MNLRSFEKKKLPFQLEYICIALILTVYALYRSTEPSELVMPSIKLSMYGRDIHYGIRKSISIEIL